MKHKAIAFCAFGALGCGAAVRAQTVDDVGGCDQIAAFVSAGTPDTNTVRASRYYLIGHCPNQRVPALASALLATRNAALERNLNDLFLTARLYKEEPIAEAARQVGNDVSADIRARAYALAVLLEYLLFDSWPSIDEMGSGTDSSGQVRTYCSIEPGTSHPPVQHGDALDGPLQNAIIGDLKRIAGNPSEPLFVRNVAACWDGPGLH